MATLIGYESAYFVFYAEITRSKDTCMLTYTLILSSYVLLASVMLFVGYSILDIGYSILELFSNPAPRPPPSTACVS